MNNSSAAQPLPEPLIELVAQRFRVLGEPMRIKLLDRLREGDATVGELQEAIGASQQNVSKHLGILHAAGMVARTKDGNHTRYSISDPERVRALRPGLRRRAQAVAGAGVDPGAGLLSARDARRRHPSARDVWSRPRV